MLFQYGLLDTKHFLFGGIAVSDEAAIIPLRTACNRRDRLTQPAAGTGFSRDQQPLALAKLQPYFSCQIMNGLIDIRNFMALGMVKIKKY